MAGQEGPPDSIVRQSSEAPQMSGLPLAIWSLPLGAALDAALGDPRGWPHPVRAIGRLIVVVEGVLRAFLSRRLDGGGVNDGRGPSPRTEIALAAERIAGVVLAAVVV